MEDTSNNNKVISAIANEISQIKKQLSDLSSSLAAKPTELNPNSNEFETLGQSIIEINKKLDLLIANQKEPNAYRTSLTLIGLALAFLIVLQEFLNRFF